MEPAVVGKIEAEAQIHPAHDEVPRVRHFEVEYLTFPAGLSSVVPHGHDCSDPAKTRMVFQHMRNADPVRGCDQRLVDFVEAVSCRSGAAYDLEHERSGRRSQLLEEWIALLRIGPVAGEDR